MEELKLQQAIPTVDLSQQQQIFQDRIGNNEDLSPKMMMSQLQDKEQMSSQNLLPALEILGAVKIRDGLFLGDEYASQDLEFVIANKVTHIINCAGRQIFNQWTPVGVKYLTFYWLDDDRQLIFDDHDQVAREIYDFIEEANQEFSGVLVHSVRGQSRACCVLSIYLMMKFKWTLLKSLEFVNSRRPNLEIRASFLQQLSQWERRTRDTCPVRTDRWDELHTDNLPEEMLLRNTFMNAQMQPVNFLQQWKEDVMNSISQSGRLARQKLKWADNGDETLKKDLARENSDLDLLNKDETQISKVDNHRKEFFGKPLLRKEIIPQPEAIVQVQSPVSIKFEDKIEAINSIKQSAAQQVSDDSIQDMKKSDKKRPITPLLKQRDLSDLMANSPRQFTQTVDKFPKKKVPKRSSSSRKIDREQEEKDKRDSFKARIAWNATSPKDKKLVLGNFKDNFETSLTQKSKHVTSPTKSASTILKKELLEKAKKALAEKSKVTVGLDIKKIQETLNKLSIGNPNKPSDGSNIQSQQSKAQGNIINNNNINNFFIQNASVIEIPKQGNNNAAVVSNKETAKAQGPIGQHHHKRTNSGSVHVAQQIKNNLAQSLSGQVSHRKNQFSEQIINPLAMPIVPFILSSNATDLFKYQAIQRPSSQMSSKKDFKSMIKELQRESFNAMQNQQLMVSQAMKYKKQSQSTYPISQQQQQYQGRSSQSSNQIHSDQLRPSSAQVKQIQQRINSANRNRRLKKPIDYLKLQTQPLQQPQRRAQTPMPTSPNNNLLIISSSQQERQAFNNSKQLQFQNATSVNNNLQQNSNNMINQIAKKRSKSPSISSYQQKLQAKTAYLLMNNANLILTKKVKNHSNVQSPKKANPLLKQ